MKKIILFALTVMLIFSMAVSAYAVTPKVKIPNVSVPNISNSVKFDFSGYFARNPVKVNLE